MMLAKAGQHEFELLKSVARIGGFSQWLTYFHRGGLSLERCRIPVSIIPVFGRYPIRPDEICCYGVSLGAQTQKRQSV